MAYNSDGYILVDFVDVDFRRANQTIEGIFERLRLVIGTNKFVLVINANGRSPLPSTVSITNGQYVIESCIYTFSIAANDNLHIKRNDVPASDLIDDSTTSADKTWSSSKITDELATKADTSDLENYQPLLTAGDNITISEDNVISATDTGAQIDDTTTSTTTVWSSDKVSTELSRKADTSDLADYQPLLIEGDNISILNNVISANVSAVIDDTTPSAITTYSSNKISTEINDVKIKSFNYTGDGNNPKTIEFTTNPLVIVITKTSGRNMFTTPIYFNKSLQSIITLANNTAGSGTITHYTALLSYDTDAHTLTITGGDSLSAMNSRADSFTVYYI